MGKKDLLNARTVGIETIYSDYKIIFLKNCLENNIYYQAISTYLRVEYALPYQPIQTCASSSCRSLLRVIWSKPGIEVFRDRTGRS